MDPRYNKLCVIILIIAAYASVLYSGFKWLQTFGYEWYFILIDFVGIAVIFAGQCICFFSQSNGDSIFDLIYEEESVFPILNKKVIIKFLMSPFYGMYLSLQLFKEYFLFSLLVIIPAFMVGLVIAIPQLIVIGAVSIILYLITTLIMTILNISDERFFRKNIKCVVCEKCGTKINDYDFLCPNCQHRFDNLFVNKYGFVSRLCPDCHTKLYIHPKKKFKQCDLVSVECPDRFNINSAQSIMISMAGAPGCGKTSYVNNIKSSNLGIELTSKIVNDPLKDYGKYTPMCYIAPTVVEYTSIYLKNPKRLMFYDINGAIFTTSGDRDYFQKQYAYHNGVIFLIDGKLIEKHNEKGLKQTEDAFDSFMTCMRNISKTKSKGRYDEPIALVINKSDLMSDEVTNENAESYIKNSGLINMVNTIRADFESYRFFVCSNRSMTGLNEPLKWIVEFECKEMAALIERK